MYSPWETHPYSQDQQSLQLGGGALQPLMGCLNCEMSFIFKEPMTWIFRATSNAPKSRIMQNM